MSFRKFLRSSAVAAALCATASLSLAQTSPELQIDSSNAPVHNAGPEPIHLRIASGQKPTRDLHPFAAELLRSGIGQAGVGAHALQARDRGRIWRQHRARRRDAGACGIRRHRYRRLLLLSRTRQSAAAFVPGDAAFRLHEPDREREDRTRGLRKSPVYAAGVRGQIRTEADRALRGFRLQPRDVLRLGKGQRSERTPDRGRRAQSEMGRECRRHPGAVVVARSLQGDADRLL